MTTLENLSEDGMIMLLVLDISLNEAACLLDKVKSFVLLLMVEDITFSYE